MSERESPVRHRGSPQRVRGSLYGVSKVGEVEGIECFIRELTGSHRGSSEETFVEGSQRHCGRGTLCTEGRVQRYYTW